jgi:hypothetical protein
MRVCVGVRVGARLRECAGVRACLRVWGATVIVQHAVLCNNVKALQHRELACIYIRAKKTIIFPEDKSMPKIHFWLDNQHLAIPDVLDCIQVLNPYFRLVPFINFSSNINTEASNPDLCQFLWPQKLVFELFSEFCEIYKDKNTGFDKLSVPVQGLSRLRLWILQSMSPFTSWNLPYSVAPVNVFVSNKVVREITNGHFEDIQPPHIANIKKGKESMDL